MTSPNPNGDDVLNFVVVGTSSSSPSCQPSIARSTAKSRPKRAKISKKKSTKLKSQELSDNTPSPTGQSASPASPASPASIIGAPDTPRDDIDSVPGVASLPSPRQTPQQQAQGEEQVPERPTKRARKMDTLKTCTRCGSVFEMQPQSACNERTNLFCARCFMQLHVCEVMWEKNKLEAQCKQYDEQLRPDNCQNRGELMEEYQFLNQRLAATASGIIKAALSPKTKELFEGEGKTLSWSRSLRGLDGVVNGRPREEEAVRLSGAQWRSEIHKWIGIAAMVLLHTFFGQKQPDWNWRCGGFCDHCKAEVEERKALMVMQKAILRGDKELPGQPLSFNRLFEFAPWNPDGTPAEDRYISNIDGRASGVNRFSPWWIENVRATKVNFNDWAVEYEMYKGYDQALQDNINMSNALDDEP